MSKQISSQATKVWQTVTDPSTANTYQQALTITWTILRETGILIWYVICLVLVAFDWFWTNSIYTGRRFRLWFDSLDQSNTSNVAAEAGRALLAASKSSVAYTVSQAREQLGFPEKQEPVLPEPAVASPKLLPTPEPSPAYTAPPATKSVETTPVTPPPASTAKSPSTPAEDTESP